MRDRPTFAGLTAVVLLVAAGLAAPAAAQDATAAEMAAVARVSAEDLEAARAAGEVLVLDVRSRTQFEAGHIAGAVHVWESQLATAAESLPPDRPIVTYCA